MKAITISSTSVASDIASQVVTVGKLKLATPTFTKTGYSDGSYTVSMSSNQTGLAFPPASTTLYYSVNGGDATEYSTAFNVAAGSTVTGYVTATNYTNSDNANLTAAVRPVLSEVWSIDFSGQATEDKGGVTVGETTFTANGVNFSNISGSFTSNDNFGVKTGSAWMLRNTGSTGLYSFNGSGTPVGVAGLTAGQYVRMVVSDMTSCSVTGATSLVDNLSTTTELYIVANEDGNANIHFNRYVYIKSIAVCDATVSATIGSTGWTTFASAYPLDLSSMTASTGTVAAYYASAIGGDKVTMTSTDSEGVAAGEGLMLKGTVGATITIPVAASGNSISGNKLVGCTSSTNLTANANYYVLVNDGNNEAEFQSLAVNGATIPAGKAYLNATGALARLSIVFDDATAIKDVDASVKSGVQADGKYLEKGKIVIVKNGTKFNANGQRMK